MATNASRPLTIFFSVGEPSGDVHGANLIRALRTRYPTLECVGFGGPRMAEAGCRVHADLSAMAVMWFLRVLLNLHTYWRAVRRARAYFREHRPDAVVLIDFPGFNWWIARAAKRHAIPVFYYVPPQVWAWARWRVRKMRRLVDHVLCCLPFEQEWYARHGCNATLVGHPFFDEVRRHVLDQQFIQRIRSGAGKGICGQESRVCPRPLVTILPGSRTQELTHNLGWLLKAAERIRAGVPNVRFAVAAFKQAHAEIVERAVATTDLPMEVHVGRTPELIYAADCCLAKSGSVSLELLYHTKPTVIVYWVNRLTYALGKRLIKVRYITLVNLLAAHEAGIDPFCEHPEPYDPRQPDADQVLFPEYPTREDKSDQLAAHVIEWLTCDAKRRVLVGRLAELKARVCHEGAAQRAADYMLGALNVVFSSANVDPNASGRRAA